METLHSVDAAKKNGLFTPIKKLLCGDVPLWVSFWIFGVLVITLFNIGFYFIIINMINIINKVGTSPVYAIIVLTTLYTILIWIAIWNSASKYKGTKILAIFAKVVVIFSVLITLLFLYLNSSFNARGTTQQINTIVMLLNKNLPAKIDNHTVLYKVGSDKSKLLYYFELVNFDENQKSNILNNQEEASNMLETSIKAKVCKSSELQRFSNQNIELVYDYILDGRQLFSIPINEKICNQN
ncbi:hypothetical protein [Legionella hackeliae]|uniref:Uncharacterized protein n=1 Tax=Legionella hackeliae TaxID=449 RepID=A0A0A8UTH6_LEGHA|nr:hypothetical protein [Legionella hackeliae]KTD14194.1 hypothetical protein Lhac_0506 [Legionella hackeliae]CEK10402.1 membrane protein of unknown function [Legionella hackeliae]STX47139.1 Uncharacterised protein [Legionella hackeliae]